jgi:hypothetical protein
VLTVLTIDKCDWRSRHENLRSHFQLMQAFEEAQVRLGERMYLVGIDDGKRGAIIRALDEQILRAESAGTSSSALKTTRRLLLMELASAALAEEGPLPGAEAEYRTAREVQRVLGILCG